jgi:hypothetical protein
MGTSGSNLMKIINEVGNKYKVISVDEGAPSDEMQNADNFGRYAFMTSASTSRSVGAWPIITGRSARRRRNSMSCARLLFRSWNGRWI